MVKYLTGKTRRLVAMSRRIDAAGRRASGVEFVQADILAGVALDEALAGIDVVVHFAGHSGASASAQDPFTDLQSNVGGTLSLLEAARKREGALRVVFPGSRLEYGRVKSLPVLETDPMHPVSPYGVNKYACELYLDLYARMYGISYAVARLTNPYGPSETPSTREYNVMNRLIAAAKNGEKLTVYGEGKQLRDYVFADDAVEALALLCASEDNIVVNVGSGIGISFLEAVETIVRVAGKGHVDFSPWPAQAERVETGDFVADIERVRALGWHPRTSFEDGIRATLAQAENYV